MSSPDWSDAENDLIVADYFAMLADDLSGRRYNMTEHRRRLAPLLLNRSGGSLETSRSKTRSESDRKLACPELPAGSLVEEESFHPAGAHRAPEALQELHDRAGTTG